MVYGCDVDGLVVGHLVPSEVDGLALGEQLRRAQVGRVRPQVHRGTLGDLPLLAADLDGDVLQVPLAVGSGQAGVGI